MNPLLSAAISIILCIFGLFAVSMTVSERQLIFKKQTPADAMTIMVRVFAVLTVLWFLTVCALIRTIDPWFAVIFVPVLPIGFGNYIGTPGKASSERATDPSHRVRRRSILAPLVLFGFAAAMACFVWPTPWRYDKLGANLFRTNRFTGQVETFTFAGWYAYKIPTVSKSVPSITTTPTDAEVKQIEAKVSYMPSMRTFTGSVYNPSKQAIRGMVIFHSWLQQPWGLTFQERRLRQEVNWPPQAISYFSVQVDYDTSENPEAKPGGQWESVNFIPPPDND